MGLKYPRRRASSVSAFGRAWGLLKAFYVDKDDPLAGWYRPYPTFSDHAWPVKRRTPLRESPDGRGYRVGLNLADPYYRYLEYEPNIGLRARTPMNEDEKIKRIIDTIVHEEGHHAILGPLDIEAYEDFIADDFDRPHSSFLPTRQTQEYGAMTVEGIPLNQQKDELRRRGYL